MTRDDEITQLMFEQQWDDMGCLVGHAAISAALMTEPLPEEDDYSNPYAAAGITLHTPLDVALPLISTRMVQLHDVAETCEDPAVW